VGIYVFNFKKDMPYKLIVQKYDFNMKEIESFTMPINEQDFIDIINLSKIQEIYFHLAVNNKEEIFILSSVNDKGITYKFSKNGKLLHKWETIPEPISPVSYVHMIKIDNNDDVYIGWGSWEACSSLTNCGGIFHYDSNGNLKKYISENVDYLVGFSVSKKGEIFLYDLGDEIKKYNSEGKLELTWNATPPKFGESWEEKAKRERLVKNISANSTIENLCLAYMYSEGQQKQQIQNLINQKEIGEFTKLAFEALKWTKFDSYSPKDIISSYISAHKAELKDQIYNLIISSDKNMQDFLVQPFIEEYKITNDPIITKIINRMARESKTYLISYFELEDETIDFYLDKINNLDENSDEYRDFVYFIKNQITKKNLLQRVLEIVKNPNNPLFNKMTRILTDIDDTDFETINEKEKFCNAFENIFSINNEQVKSAVMQILAKCNIFPDIIAYLKSQTSNDATKSAAICNILNYLYSKNELNKEQWGIFLNIFNNISNENELQNAFYCLYSQVKSNENIPVLLNIVKEVKSKDKYKNLYMISPVEHKEIIPLYYEAIDSDIPDKDKSLLCSELGKIEDEKCKNWLKEKLLEAKNEDFTYILNAIKAYPPDTFDDILIGRFPYLDKKDQYKVLTFVANGSTDKRWSKYLENFIDDPYIDAYVSIALLRIGDKRGLKGVLDGFKKLGLYSSLDSSYYSADLFKPFLPGIFNDLRALLDYPNNYTQLLAAKILFSFQDEAGKKKLKELLFKDLNEKGNINLEILCLILEQEPQIFDDLINQALQRITKGEKIWVDAFSGQCANENMLFSYTEKFLDTRRNNNSESLLNDIVKQIADYGNDQAKKLLKKLQEK